jgi:hypothetical protein
MKRKTKSTNKRDWTPRRVGRFFCSPACGARCTWKAYEKAVVDSEQLAAKLGDGWAARVWENMGWHWELTKGSLTKYSYMLIRLTHTNAEGY